MSFCKCASPTSPVLFRRCLVRESTVWAVVEVVEGVVFWFHLTLWWVWVCAEEDYRSLTQHFTPSHETSYVSPATSMTCVTCSDSVLYRKMRCGLCSLLLLLLALTACVVGDECISTSPQERGFNCASMSYRKTHHYYYFDEHCLVDMKTRKPMVGKSNTFVHKETVSWPLWQQVLCHQHSQCGLEQGSIPSDIIAGLPTMFFAFVRRCDGIVKFLTVLQRWIPEACCLVHLVWESM